MRFEFYNKQSEKTAIYPKDFKIIYPLLGLSGEVGEVCEKIKKTIRDNNGKISLETLESLKKEMGDVLWYWFAVCRDLEFDPSEIAQINIDKLMQRKEKNTLKGSGDNR